MTTARQELRHGYTIADLDQLTRTAVLADRSRALPYRHAWDTARSAIAVALYEADTPPTRSDLITAGWRGIYDEVRATRHQYGYRDRDATAGVASAPMFVRYWRPAAESWTDSLIERLATTQVHAAVSTRDRELINALVVFGDNRAAAAALGMLVTTYGTAVAAARQRWLALWFDGPVPQRRHRHRPRHRYDETGLAPCGTHAAYRRHRKRREPIDQACRAANSDRTRAYRAQRRAAA
jgi:hypothetical protein